MWSKKTDGEDSVGAVPETHSNPPSEVQTMPAARPRSVDGRAGDKGARLGGTLTFKGELTGQEDLVVDGKVEGTVNLGENVLTVGNQGKVEADVLAREVIIEGSVRGNVKVSDRLLITRNGNVMGEVVAARIVIEDGAYFKGSIDIQKPGEQKQARESSYDRSLRVATPTSAGD